MSMKLWLQSSCALLVLSGAPNLAAHTITVGSPAYPDLAAAIADVPRLKASLADGEAIEIRLPPGATRLKAPIEIDGPHGGSPAHRLIIRGDAGGTTRFVGTATVPTRPATAADAPGFALPSGVLVADLRGLPSPAHLVARGNYVATTMAGFELYQGSARLAPSRWPVNDYATTTPQGANSAGPSFALPPDRAKAWASEPAPWAGGFWGAPWSFELAPVVRIDPQGAQGQLAPLQSQQEPNGPARYFVENLIGELKAPGQYVLLPQKQQALVLPMPGGGALEAAVLPRLIGISGAAQIEIRDIAFDRSLGEAANVLKSSDILFEHCAFRQTGGDGVIVRGGSRVVLSHSVIASTAETGVELTGGDRNSLTPGGHRFENGVITDFGLEEPTYRPAAHLTGVGQVLTGSLLQGGDHNAVMLAGNDHRVTGNEIAYVLRHTEDAGAVYMGNDWTQRGMVIDGNYFHHLGGQAVTQFLSAVYLDDQSSGQTVTNNIVVGGDYGVVIGGGRDNVVRANTFYGPRRGGVHYDERGTSFQAKAIPAFVQRLGKIPYQGDVWAKHYPTLAGLQSADYGKAQGNVLRDNRSFGAAVLVADARLQASPGLAQSGNATLAMAAAPKPPLSSGQNTHIASLLPLRQVPPTSVSPAR
ncbi:MULTISPECIES: right-handed parallel beta-helix repeat-containing protein [unclassified Novosphingobium]|uniref:right-handed parallel beta-helix repeat-containing protein n=1 Tax=unclassified Novosphingobium TaxID=2644732 RepID=UPI00086F39D8|nr:MULTISPECIES: right-handed parallel beta-helix repeat-containing protein [unclassified Novosphingobium]MBN9142842.1 right-handed parallel beta-helix repeat-containing protein [Novosphingobium sp.]MDR6705927.1 parallel beta-helix repeat protein [Novosphingobium sp. 1748]ODU84999.1 MAG: hypothetical protein ABT10_01765 [Novosphingobium sp. SCN 63-17]OJX89221.1 MAG: hypothetical protein BGP00_13310 [Novosphingobium sp. 63-713]